MRTARLKPYTDSRSSRQTVAIGVELHENATGILIGLDCGAELSRCGAVVAEEADTQNLEPTQTKQRNSDES
jgi:hypothetical protein